jgi:predicted transcriptional regulator
MGRHQLENTHRRYQIEQMWSQHHEIVRLALVGMKQIDIASHLGISPVTVSYTLRSPIVARQLEQMQAVRNLGAIDIAKQIAALAPRAVEVLDKLLDDPLPNVALKAAESILDRAGYAAVQRIKTDITVSHFTSAEISDIKSRARDIGLLLEAEYSEVPQQRQIAQGGV